ncbi:glycosyltransferase [candidate division GN15 bacterium]|nr:glycosyltransferase [candidate division GN15 bacterium]
MTEKKITIAYVIDTIVTPSAGTEKQLLMLLRGLDRTRFRPVLVCLRDSDWLQSQQFDFDFELIGLGALMRPDFFKAVRRFKELHARYNFDIVQTFFVDGNIFGNYAGHKAGVKQLVSSRRNIGYWHGLKDKLILRWLRRWTHHYLANSKSVIDVAILTEHVDPSIVKVIYNGLDLERFVNIPDDLRVRQRQEWGIADDQTLIGVMANLRPVKNQGVLIDAMAKLADSYPRLRAVLVGEGSLRPAFQAQIDRADLQGRVQMVGAYEDILPCLAAFDIGVLCSLSESFSNSLVEYLAAGLPVVASNVGGNPEAVTPGETGLLFDLKDPDDLPRKLRELLDDPEMARRMGAAAKDTAHRRFSRESCLRQHEEYYQTILEAR